MIKILKLNNYIDDIKCDDEISSKPSPEPCGKFVQPNVDVHESIMVAILFDIHAG